jgi:hypothetical protein
MMGSTVSSLYFFLFYSFFNIQTDFSKDYAITKQKYEESGSSLFHTAFPVWQDKEESFNPTNNFYTKPENPLNAKQLPLKPPIKPSPPISQPPNVPLKQVPTPIPKSAPPTPQSVQTPPTTIIVPPPPSSKKATPPTTIIVPPTTIIVPPPPSSKKAPPVPAPPTTPNKAPPVPAPNKAPLVPAPPTVPNKAPLVPVNPPVPKTPPMTQSHQNEDQPLNYSQQFEGEWNEDIPAIDFSDKIAGWF